MASDLLLIFRRFLFVSFSQVSNDPVKAIEIKFFAPLVIVNYTRHVVGIDLSDQKRRVLKDWAITKMIEIHFLFIHLYSQFLLSE